MASGHEAAHADSEGDQELFDAAERQRPETPTSPIVEPLRSHPAAFTFPTLSPDGSVEDVSSLHSGRYYPTPPAALSSLGLRMKMEQDQHSEPAAFSDNQYDMLDDISDFSNDGHETASIASTERASSVDGELTPDEETDSLYGEEGGDTMPAPAEPELDESGVYVAGHEEVSAERDVTASTSETDNERAKYGKDTFDDLLSDDLETPRQSTIRSVRFDTDRSPSRPCLSDRRLDPPGKPLSVAPSIVARNRAAKRWQIAKTIFTNGATFMLMCILTSMISSWVLPRTTPIAEHAIRREALVEALVTIYNDTDITRTINIDHLLPAPILESVNILGYRHYRTQEYVHSATTGPNHMLVSLPRQKGWSKYQRLAAVRTDRSDGVKISNNHTKLIEGVYDIIIDKAQAYETVNFVGTMSHPQGAFIVSHDFGRRYLQRQTYENVGKEISNEMAAAQKVAASFQQKLQDEMAASAAATKNVTTALALRCTQELQVLAKTATSMLDKLSEASGRNLASVRKNVAAIQKDLVKVSKSLQKSLEDTTETATETVRSKLKTSRARALRLQELLLAKTKANTDVSGYSMTKDISTRMQDAMSKIKSVTAFSKKADDRSKPRRDALPAESDQDPKVRRLEKKQRTRNGKTAKVKKQHVRGEDGLRNGRTKKTKAERIEKHKVRDRRREKLNADLPK